MKPSAAIEDVATTMIHQDDGLIGWGGKEFVLKILREKLASLETNRVVFFAGTNIEKAQGLVSGEAGLQFRRGDEHFAISLVTGEEFGNRFLDRNFIAGADFGERFVIAVGTALAAADMIGGHAVSGADRDWGCWIHERSMERIATNSSVCEAKFVL
jgi:hypothetical protein